MVMCVTGKITIVVSEGFAVVRKQGALVILNLTYSRMQLDPNKQESFKTKEIKETHV